MAESQKIIGTATGGKEINEYSGKWTSSWITTNIFSERYITAEHTTTSGQRYATPVCYRFEVDNNLTDWTAIGLYFDTKSKSQYSFGVKATFYEQDPTSSSATGYDGGVLTIDLANVYIPKTYQTNISTFSGKKTFYVIIELTSTGWHGVYFQPIEVGLIVSPPPLTFTTDKDTVKPNETFTVTFGNRLDKTVTTNIKYKDSVLATQIRSRDAETFLFANSWLNYIDKSYGQFTIEVSDDIERVATGTINFQLDSLKAHIDKQTVETNTGAYIGVDNSYGKNLSYEILSGSSLIDSGDFPSSHAVLGITPMPWWFSDVGNNSNSMSVTVNISDTFGRTTSVSFTATAGPEMYPEIGNITLTNVPAANMPSGYGFIANYSKVKISAPVTIPSIASSVTVVVSYYGSEPISMSYNESTEEYEATTTSVITGDTTFTIIATDSNTRQAQKSKQLTNVETLSPITISLSNYSVNAGSNVTVEVDGNVGNYDYFLEKGNLRIGSDYNISESTFSFTASASWFPNDPSVSSINIKITVTDALGRTANNSFSVNLPQLTISLDQSIVIIGDPIEITLDGTSGQTIQIVFTTPKNNETVTVYSGTATGTSKTVICHKSWFDQYGFNYVASLPITVSATAGAQKATAQFSLNYPALGLAITKTVDSQEVAVTSATVGDNLNYTFSNLAGESVNVNYVYTAQNNRQLLQYGPYSTAQTIATPQLFDLANPPVTKSMSMQVNIVISDVRGRTATVSNFTINASESMRPGVYDFTFEPINPPTVDSAFATDFIGNVSRLNATIKASPGSMAKVTEAILSIDGANVTMTPSGVDSNGKYVFTYVGNSPLQVEAIYDPRQVNITVGYGLNSDGEVVENPQRAATVYPISVRKNNAYTVYYSGQYTAQCALWSGYTFGRIVTNSQYSPYEVSFDTGNCDKVYVSLMRKNETSETDPVDVEEANLMIRMNDSGMASNLTPISFDVTVKDERGLSDTMWVGTAYAYPYNAPNASIGYHRCNQDGTPNDSGGNCLLTCDFAFEGLWLNTFPPTRQNEGYVTVSTSNYDETKEFDFAKRKKSQFTLEAGYGLNSSGEVVSNPLRAATVVPIEMPSEWTGTPFFTVTFSGDYVVDYAGFYGTELNRIGTITSSGGGGIAPDIEDLYISLRRANETAESDPVDIAEANVQVIWNLGNSEDGSFEFLIPNMSIEQTYQITITLTDLITSTVYTVTLSTGYAIMDFYRGGKGVAIGKVAEHSTMLEVNPDWELKASVKINGQLYDLATLLSQIKQQLGI